MDRYLYDNPNSNIIVCGDLNRLNLSSILQNCTLVNAFIGPTYGEAQLDYILLSENLIALYDVTDCAPFDNSSTPHKSLLATPVVMQKREFCVTRPVYDLRRSNIAHFISEITKIDWSSLYKSTADIDVLCNHFHNQLNLTFEKTISISLVTYTTKDKPWINSYVKSLINRRWTAFRNRDFPLYNNLKLKVRDEIEKAKNPG